MITTSKLTGKQYEHGVDCIYMSNPQQCFFYLSTIGEEYLLDILPGDAVRKNMMVFVWRKCKETAECKRMWDERGKNRNKN